MEIKLKKPIKNLQKEVLVRSIDLEDDIEDFQLNIGNYESNDKFITISPRCVRCNLCVEECPVDAISSPSFVKESKIQDNCVKCEICAQTCPVSCIYVMEADSNIDKEKNNIEYNLNNIKVPHRVIRMEDISIDRNKCGNCETCVKFCPTNAISIKDKSLIEVSEDTEFLSLEDGNYPFIKKSLCVGCGSCANLCPQEAINLKRILGPLIENKCLSIDQDICAECNLCEETCPVEAIKLEDGKIILDNSKCIKCNVCSSKCPVNALSLNNTAK